MDDDIWKLTDGTMRYAQRALAARGGMWGNHGYEAAYAMAYLDGAGAIDSQPGSGTILRAQLPLS